MVFDVVVWGSTGFTGKLIAEYLARSVAKGAKFTWAAAGRTPAKVNELAEQIQKEFGTLPSVIVCSDPEEAVKKAKVIISAAGPFLECGTPVVDACVKHQVDYVDITGETPWVRQIIDKYHERAAQSRTCIVPMCGFDSVPSDLGTLFTAGVFREANPAKSVRRVRTFATMSGRLSGGTLSTGILMDKMKLQDQLANPFLLGGLRDPYPEELDNLEPQFDEKLQIWSGPFMMARLNSRVVRRSHYLLQSGFGDDAKFPFDRDFVYTERQYAPTDKAAKVFSRQLSSVPPPEVREKLMAAGSLPKPGEGPTAEQRREGSFKFIFHGEGEPGTRDVFTTFSGATDPGYQETAKFVSESALTLVANKDSRRFGGVLTPAVACGHDLIARLSKCGNVFSQHSSIKAALAYSQAKI